MRYVMLNPVYDIARRLKERDRQCLIYHRDDSEYFSTIMYHMFKHTFHIQYDHFVPADFVVVIDENPVVIHGVPNLGEIVVFCCCKMTLSDAGMPLFYAYFGGSIDDIVAPIVGLLQCLKCAINDVIRDEDKYLKAVHKSNGSYKIIVDFQMQSERNEVIDGLFDDALFHMCSDPEEFGMVSSSEYPVRMYDGHCDVLPNVTSPSDLIEAAALAPTTPSDAANSTHLVDATTPDDSSRLLKRARRGDE